MSTTVPSRRPVRHNQRKDASRIKWVDPNDIGETPGPSDYDQAQLSVSRSNGRLPCTKFSQSERDDIDNLPCLGPAPDKQMLKSDMELFPGPDRYGVVQPVKSRVQGGPFPVGQRRDHIDEALSSSMHVPGPAHYDGGYTESMILPNGGSLSNVPKKGWLDLIMERANDTPGPTHGHRINQDHLSTKRDQTLGVKCAHKAYMHNYQTSLQNAVSYHAETMHQLGPNQCRSDSAFNEQCLTYSKNAPSFSFGSDSCKQNQKQVQRERAGAKKLLPKKKRGQKARNNMSPVAGYIAPRISKKNDFEKFYGYNPGASATDLKKYFGYDRGLGKTGKNMSASKSLNSLSQSGKKYRKKKTKKKKGPQFGPKGQVNSVGGRAGNYIKVQPTPGPNYSGASQFGKVKCGPGTFGTD